MDTGAEMTIRLAELPCERSFRLPVAFVRTSLEGLPLRDALEATPDDPEAGSGEAALSVYGEGENVFVRGSLRGWVEVACSRCVGRARVPVDEELQVTFMPTAHIPAKEPSETEDEGAEITGDDLDLYPYEGEEIDLKPLFRDQIILAVPFAPLCGEDCQGLCPKCGADLNERQCGCDPHVVDPRLAALKDIEL